MPGALQPKEEKAGKEMGPARMAERRARVEGESTGPMTWVAGGDAEGAALAVPLLADATCQAVRSVSRR